MENLAQGQSDQIALLFRRYKNELFAFYYRLNKKAALSEDLVQNVFIRIMKYHRSYKKNGSFRSWIYQIARNVHYDYHQSNQEQMQYDLERVDLEQVIEHDSHKKDDLDLLDDAFLKLGQDKRELIILHRFQKLSYKEIAKMMNSNEAAIKVKMFRIIQELREIYRSLESEEG